MSTKKAATARPDADSKPSSSPDVAVQECAGVVKRNADRMQTAIRGVSKTDSRYWMQTGKMKLRSGNWTFQYQVAGKRLTFSTRTGNRDSAALKAGGIVRDIVLLGVDVALAKHRTQKPIKLIPIATVGEWIKAARKVSSANLVTFGCYSASLRKITGDILGVKRTKARFGGRSGGAKDYRAEIDAASLDVLSFAAIRSWRLAYVGQAKNPAQRRSRETSCNSTIRQAKSLFAGSIVYDLKDSHTLPVPIPFAIPEDFQKKKNEHPLFFKKHDAKYFSRIDARVLLQKAQAELAETDGPAFLAMLLALAGGLRKAEIDSLAWHQIDFQRGFVRVESTEDGRVKSEDSRAEVPLDAKVLTILQGFKAKSSGSFVLEASDHEAGAKRWGRAYRAEGVFTRLYAWLRANGVKAQKPLHELRKELGSLLVTEHGIYAASKVLRHSNVKVTEDHYAHLKELPALSIGGWLTPENVEVEDFAAKSKTRRTARPVSKNRAMEAA